MQIPRTQMESSVTNLFPGKDRQRSNTEYVVVLNGQVKGSRRQERWERRLADVLSGVLCGEEEVRPLHAWKPYTQAPQELPQGGQRNPRSPLGTRGGGRHRWVSARPPSLHTHPGRGCYLLLALRCFTGSKVLNT